MASYDTSIIIGCFKGNKEFCEIIFKDTNCIIPPTTWEEVKFRTRPEAFELRNKVKDHCKVYGYDEPPFSDFDVKMDIDEFVDEVRINWYHGRPKKGRGAMDYNRKLRYFKRNCIGSLNPKHAFNDYRIYKETNVLGEEGVVDELITNDKSQYLEECQAIYEEIMEKLGEERKIKAREP